MAIRMMTTKQKYEANPEGVVLVHDYPGHESDLVMHSYGCPYYHDPRKRGAIPEECVAAGRTCSHAGPLYMRMTHQGLVVSLRENNGYDDSDFYAVVWNDEKNATEEIMYASTRGWTYPNNAWVDASPEVVQKYENWLKEKREAQRKYQEEQEAREVKISRWVDVVRGKEQGVSGRVFWLQEKSYGYHNKTTRIGVALDEEKENGRYKNVVWTYAKNCDVVVGK